jgi:ABC-type dipeptide/oligopeptide/nickel transport system permease subunit
VMLGQAMLFEAALCFLGLGVQPPTPAWGPMLRARPQDDRASRSNVTEDCRVWGRLP